MEYIREKMDINNIDEAIDIITPERLLKIVLFLKFKEISILKNGRVRQFISPDNNCHILIPKDRNFSDYKRVMAENINQIIKYDNGSINLLINKSFAPLRNKQTILGQIPSKPNCYKIITINGHPSLSKEPKLVTYENSFYLQCNRYRNKNINGLFEAYIDCYMPSNRQDLDNVLKIFLDSLQKCNAIKNDRNCIKIMAQKFIDKDNPRIEFYLNEI